MEWNGAVNYEILHSFKIKIDVCEWDLGPYLTLCSLSWGRIDEISLAASRQKGHPNLLRKMMTQVWSRHSSLKEVTSLVAGLVSSHSAMEAGSILPCSLCNCIMTGNNTQHSNSIVMKCSSYLMTQLFQTSAITLQLVF